MTTSASTPTTYHVTCDAWDTVAVVTGALSHLDALDSRYQLHAGATAGLSWRDNRNASRHDLLLFAQRVALSICTDDSDQIGSRTQSEHICSDISRAAGDSVGSIEIDDRDWRFR